MPVFPVQYTILREKLIQRGFREEIVDHDVRRFVGLVDGQIRFHTLAIERESEIVASPVIRSLLDGLGIDRVQWLQWANREVLQMPRPEATFVADETRLPETGTGPVGT